MRCDRFTKPSLWRSEEKLLATARAFAQDAEPLVGLFVERELAPTFLDELKANIARYEQIQAQIEAGTQTRVTATASIDEAIERGMDAVRELEAVVPNRYAGQEAVLAAWGSARHIERTGARQSPPVSPPGGDGA